ncbi:GNAT family N-acetyltransferase [Candidatus Woesearchaeota archaeon]|nr:GNAT family N-acetyltransferase [Candidatus Woesearchaeota archaeon]
MPEKIIVKEATFDDVAKVNKTIVEFDTSYNKEYFQDRCGNKQTLVIVAYLKIHKKNTIKDINHKNTNNQKNTKELPIGYIVAYDRFGKSSFYCWMVGVNPKYRGKGALKAMMQYLEAWAKKKGYRQLRIKTRNIRRGMLNYLVKYDYNFVEVIKKENIFENRILMQKEI